MYLNSPFVNPGCYWYGGPPIHASHWMVMTGEKGWPNSYCGEGSGNSVSANGAVLASTGGFGSAGATFNITDIPNQPGLLYSGPNRLSNAFGCGTRCVGGQVTRGPILFPATNMISTSFDMSASNTINIQYWYRDPANAPNCSGEVFNLSNALKP